MKTFFAIWAQFWKPFNKFAYCSMAFYSAKSIPHT
ncbi:uncharacterized protein METZ01_LOCUS293537, partial [marine metagenome]